MVNITSALHNGCVGGSGRQGELLVDFEVEFFHEILQ